MDLMEGRSTWHPILHPPQGTIRLASCRVRSTNRTSFPRMPRSMAESEELRLEVVVPSGDQGTMEVAHPGTTLVAFLMLITTATTALYTSGTR